MLSRTVAGSCPKSERPGRSPSLESYKKLTTGNYLVRPASIFSSALAPACAAANRAVSTRKGEQET